MPCHFPLLKSFRRKRLPKQRRDVLRDYYTNGRRKLIEQLGGACACCGWDVYEDLQIDHKNPTDKRLSRAQISRKNRWSRLFYYRRQAERGLIQVLCKKCNRSKGDGDSCSCKGKGWGRPGEAA